MCNFLAVQPRSLRASSCSSLVILAKLVETRELSVKFHLLTETEDLQNILAPPRWSRLENEVSMDAAKTSLCGSTCNDLRSRMLQPIYKFRSGQDSNPRAGIPAVAPIPLDQTNLIHALNEYGKTNVADKANRRNFDGILIDDETRYESREDSPRLHLTEQQQLNLCTTLRKHHFLGDDNNLGGKGRGKGQGRCPRSYAVGGGGRNSGIVLGLSLSPMSPSLSLHDFLFPIYLFVS
ncbi:hypothetical protein YC2023_005519 [Brassica napus]